MIYEVPIARSGPNVPGNQDPKNWEFEVLIFRSPNILRHRYPLSKPSRKFYETVNLKILWNYICNMIKLIIILVFMVSDIKKKLKAHRILSLLNQNDT